MNEKETLEARIDELKTQLKDARNRIDEIERREREKNRKRHDIISRIKNKKMMNVVFPYYDNIYTSSGYRKPTGKVILRNWGCTPYQFNALRNLAKSITDYVSFHRRSDGYVEQTTVKRNLDKLDDAEMQLVVDCTDELLAVLYKYKVLCQEHQNIDYSDFFRSERRRIDD